ncbi:hypothetical protein [Microbulbifer sp. SAOS-129_SWC]|uniref:hypothetical protein n=1 Tax=Microbulbifer sp. SAOS-129_SWC TaxID=3145235 RepID=UPI00321635E0
MEPKEKEFQPFVDIKPDSTSDLDVTVFFPAEVDGAKVSSTTIYMKDGDKVNFAIYSDFILAKNFKSFKKFKGAALINFGMIENYFINTRLTVMYSYPPSEDGIVLTCGPVRQYKLSELPRKSV